MYLGLVAIYAETGDLLDGELYPGATYLGNRALKMTLRLVDHCRGRLCDSMMVRMDAGFPEPGLLKGLESRSVPYIARIRNNEVLNRMAQPHLTQRNRARGGDRNGGTIRVSCRRMLAGEIEKNRIPR